MWFYNYFIFNNSQFSCRDAHFFTMPLSELVKYLLFSFDWGKTIYVVPLDHSKSVDCEDTVK